MLVTFEKIDELAGGFVDFYTVKIGTQELTEFELFDGKDFPDHKKEIQIVYNTLNEIKFRGAKRRYFKFEGSAEALPFVPFELMDANQDDFGIRLYCKIVSEEILILFNGDVKTVAGRAIACLQVEPHFTLATKIGLRLDKAIFQRDIDLSEPNPFENFEIDI